jgi:predicted pyridoxine 5'-phosphate oxidase superfamily flavin-nucleotide-binding protein
MDAPGRTVSAIVESTNLDLKIVATLQERFAEVITTEQELRNIVGPANRWFTSKILDKLDRRCQDFIAASPFVLVGSTDPSGLVDLSPKGDRAGFVACLDEATLAIPDRRGNRRVDTFHNVLQNPGVGLIFFVPGQRETLRVTGRAIIVRDQISGARWQIMAEYQISRWSLALKRHFSTAASASRALVFGVTKDIERKPRNSPGGRSGRRSRASRSRDSVWNASR